MAARTDSPSTHEPAADAVPVSSREAIVVAARRLFAERGYASVSIRDVAAAARVSPALVIKYVGTKEGLFREAVEFTPVPEIDDAPVERLGEAVVARILASHRAGRPAPLTRAVVLVLPAPDPEDVRRRLREAYLVPLAQRLGGTPEAHRRAENALAAATGLSVSLRCFHHHQDPAHDDELVARYGAALQLLLDA